MKRRYIAEQWNDYLRRVMPKDAGETQRRETKRAFYAGAHSILFGVVAAMSPEDEPTEADIEVLKDIQAEAEAFVADVKAGRA